MQSRLRAGLNSALPSNQRLADASRLLGHTGPLSVYKIPLKENEINVPGCRRLIYGEESSEQNRTIVVLGATGAGKSTLINGMMNYVLGVEWEDSFRFKLVDERRTNSQAHSQTSEVTVYKINHQDGFKIDYSLTIVDTPGFGDTRGIEKDKEIVEQLRNLFTAEHGLSEIDAVCFVAQASLARLTPTQKYVFDSVLSIFGEDVAENIRVMVTFADGQRPPVLEAIKASGVPCPKTKDGLPLHFKFNNSALFADNKSSAAGSMSDDGEDGSFDQMFWNMGTKSMERFFDALNLMETKSLTTAESPVEREQLHKLAKNMERQADVGIAKLKEIKQTKEKLKEHEEKMSSNEYFEFETSVKKSVQEDVSGSRSYLTICQRCHVTCHGPCRIPSDEHKIQCWVMGPTGRCTRCPGKCYFNEHFSKKYKWDSEEVKEIQHKKDQEKKRLQALIEKRIAEYKRVQAEVEKLIASYAKCLYRPEETPLMPHRSTPEYIDMLIEGETSEAKLGWRQRVWSLKITRDKAEYMTQEEREVIGFQCCNQGQRKSRASHDNNNETETKRPRLEQDQQTRVTTKTTPRRTH